MTEVSLAGIQNTFKYHAYWDDLNDEKSNLVTFLKEVCGTADGKLNTFTMRSLGILWCKGKVHEKVHELYYNMQDNNLDEIAAEDKDFHPNTHKLFDLATEMAINQE